MAKEKTLEELRLDEARITQNIASLNSKITSARIQGENVYGLESRKTSLVDELAVIQHNIRATTYSTTHPNVK